MTEYKVTVDDYGTARWYDQHFNCLLKIEWIEGKKEWFQGGKLHRLDGAAVEYANGDKSYFINGRGYSEEQFNYEIARRNKLKTPALTYEGKVVEVDGKKYKLVAL